MNLSATLIRIMQSSFTHAAWLNSLSYLEYRGFRKIARSQGTADMTLEMLTHTMEEVRHALFFKKQAVRLGGARFKNYEDGNMLCASQVKKYFFDLDEAVARILDSTGDVQLARVAYCLITWLIEERAMSVYGEYHRLLKADESGFSLTAILNEEIQHLKDMADEARQVLDSRGIRAADLQAIEDKCFTEVWTQIEISVLQPAEEFVGAT